MCPGQHHNREARKPFVDRTWAKMGIDVIFGDKTRRGLLYQAGTVVNHQKGEQPSQLGGMTPLKTLCVSG